LRICYPMPMATPGAITALSIAVRDAAFRAEDGCRSAQRRRDIQCTPAVRA
jgi:hypothetical protein